MSTRRPAMGAFAAAMLLSLTGPVRALDVAVPYVRGDYVWAQGHSGAGVEIGVIDIYFAYWGHPAIAGNYRGSERFTKTPGYWGSHATQVTGTAASQDTTYKGAAPAAGWWTAQTGNPASRSDLPTQTAAAETFAQGLSGLGGNGVEVITTSIGFASGDTSAMDHWSLGLDHIIHENGPTITVAAGNSGPNLDTLDGLPTGAYNAIIVGATGDTNGSPSEDYSHLASYSSRGPTSDGRCKPDIVAPGSVLHLPTLNSAWIDGSGTSFATPMVAGGAALLIGAGRDLGYSTDPKVIKSVLLNSADKLAGWSNTPTQPLDFNQGAGQMNLQNAYLQYLPGENDPGAVPATGWDRHEITPAAENLYSIEGYIPAGNVIALTLTWDRIVTADNPTKLEDVQYTADHLDNLDLFLYDAADPGILLAGSVSSVDNVEHIYFTPAEGGRYVIGVKMSGAAPGAAEIYGLSWHMDPAIQGDANVDGVVDGQDFTILKSTFGDAGAWGGGDFNGDGLVDGQDFTILKAHFGEGTPSGGATVPEPAALTLLGLGACLPLLRRRTCPPRAAGRRG